MDHKMRTPPPRDCCRGCLALDRSLQRVSVNFEKMYANIMKTERRFHGPLLLCWECKSRLKQYWRFRRQCREAHGILIRHLQTPTVLTSLSKLAVVRNNNVINIYHEHEETEKNEGNKKIIHEYENYTQTQLIKYDDITTKYNDSVNYGVNNTFHDEDSFTTGEPKADETNKRETNIQFIKIEEDAAIDDVEGYYDDGGFDHQDDNDDKNIAVVFEPAYEGKITIKSKRNNKKKLENDFNDSDEEPLTNKKRRKTAKERKDKRKKDEDVSKKRKGPAGKRETPAGVVSNPRVNKKLQQLNVGEGQLEMVVLSWEEVEAERQKALSSIVFTRHEYRCHDCILGFNHRFKLDNHMKKHDPAAGGVVCSVCAVRCRDADALCAHRRRHRVRWRCCQCGETASRAAVAADHVARAHHAPPPTHTCSVCGHAEPTLGKLRNHIKNHAERQKCELCGKTFRDRASLRTHLFIHKGEKEYSCPRCGKQFLFKKAMQVHLVTHDAPALLYCYQCDMNFKNHMSYSQHMKYSLKHIDPAKLKYACGLCDKKFAQALRLREHHLAVHLRATPVACALPGCSFTCSTRPVLRTHIRMVHRNARAQRNHVCDTCGKTYTTKKILEGHMRSHTGERPFACALCAATFGYSAALYNHNKLVHLKAKRSRRPPQPPVTLQIPEPQLNIP